ncbi:MAG: hypothetical protein QGG36_09420 [Pirellulaceae bacterium]|jgi:hypothetical protein|nr:hypothetical protein [Pirellulaceae bacterium]MDP7016006.1 hypothetical protein [Pirellulaceae bacterium]
MYASNVNGKGSRFLATLRQPPWDGVWVVVLTIALIAMLLWLASLGGPVSQPVETWPMM